MVNYLWPSLTILFAVLFNRIGTRWWLYPGLGVTFAGIVVILNGDQGFSFSGFAVRFAENSVSYLLELTAAMTWAGYSSTTRGIVRVLFGGIAVGMAYAAWTRGMSRGNMAVLAAASYFTPVLSCVFVTFWIDAKLDSGFWSGVALVVAGALLCWDAIGRGMRALKTVEKRGN